MKPLYAIFERTQQIVHLQRANLILHKEIIIWTKVHFTNILYKVMIITTQLGVHADMKPNTVTKHFVMLPYNHTYAHYSLSSERLSNVPYIQGCLLCINVGHTVLPLSPLSRHCFKLLSHIYSQQWLPYLLQWSISFWHNINIYYHNPLPVISYFIPTINSTVKPDKSYTCYE
jgi:hypothetical protein